MHLPSGQDLSDKRSGADTGPIRPRTNGALGATAQELALLDELRAAWAVRAGAPLLVVGRLTALRSADDNALYFLENLLHPETGVELVYPGPSAVSVARVFVPPPDGSLRVNW